MPPKVKYSREQIIDAAVGLVRDQGMTALTARELGKVLKVSVKPIFTAFENMDQLKAEVKLKALNIYKEYQKDFIDYSPAFKRGGMQIIKFAKEEPKLFYLLFMQQENSQLTFHASIVEVLNQNEELLDVVMNDYSLSKKDATRLFELMWIETYGIAVLTAQGVCCFTEKEISEMLSTVFIGILNVIKSGGPDAEYLKKSKVKHK